ncbi:hypothetical protein [Ferrimonas pelagia]|uniref:Uncharacterized protein n=1 Tax=Ferrimonas pelagia TaxID=1177826 RepID=A0ABP9EF24_9GAMM
MKILSLPLLLLTLLTACASGPTVEQLEQSQDQRQALVDDVALRIVQLETLAQDDDLGWFATAQVRKARTALQDAKAQYALFGEDPARMYERLGVFSTRSRLQAAQEALQDSEAAFDEAKGVRELAMEHLALAFANREVLRSLNAASLHPGRYQQLDQRLKGLVDAVAAGRLSRVRSGKPELLRHQHELEVSTVRDLYLTDHRQSLEQLRAASLDQTAPQTFAQASATLEAAWALVEGSPRALEQIAERAEATRFAIAHAHHLGNDLQQLDEQDKAGREIYLLAIEGQLAQLARTLALHDLREFPLQQQLTLLQDALEQHLSATDEAAEPSLGVDEQD